MIVRIAGRGHSFKGAGLYYLHDKEAMSTDRVEWTDTRNMNVTNPTAAMNYMAYTAMNSNKLKQEAGIPLTGKKRTRGEVYTFSLSWSPEENPDQKTMIRCADETLTALGLEDHQAVLAAHNDTNHPHLHLIVNLVNPNDGRMKDPDWGSKLKMSDWALKYEFENGQNHCPQRLKNHEKRLQGEHTRYQEPRHHLKEKIQEIYRESDSGKSFVAALQAQGYTLAKGNRRRFTLVDDTGKIYSLSRQLDKEQRKDHLQKLADIKHQDLPLAQDVSKDRQYFDRDKYNAEQQQKIEDAAIEQERQKMEVEKKQPKEQQVQTPEPKEKTYVVEPLYVKVDRLKKWEQWADKQRHTLKEQHKKAYKRKALVKEISILKTQVAVNDNKWGRKLGHFQKLKEQLETKELNLVNMDWRIAEQVEALEKKLDKTRPQGFSGGGRNHSQLTRDLGKDRKRLKDTYDKQAQKYTNEQDNTPDSDNDRKRGYDLDR